MDFNSTEPLFLFPYFGEKCVDVLPISDNHRIEIAKQLIEALELYHHVMGEGFGIWGIPQLMISDKLRILPPLWVNYSDEALRFVQHRDDVFVAPEIFKGKYPTSDSDCYVLGKVLNQLLPEKVKEEFSEFLDLLTDPDPKKRPSHFGRLFNDKINIPSKKDAFSGLVEREIVSSHIVERDLDLREFNSYYADLKPEETGTYLIHGDTRVGKTTFLNLLQTDLRNNGWKTVMATSINQFSQELLQLTENPEYAGVNLADFQYLWDLSDSYNLDRVARIIGKLIGIMENVAILVDDFDTIDDSYLKLLDYIQSMIIPSKVMITAVSCKKESNFHFSRKFYLKPFTKEQSKKFLEILLGKGFVSNYQEHIDWIFKLTNGYPGLIYNFLMLLNSTGKLRITEGKWYLDGDIYDLHGMDDYVEKLLGILDEKEVEFLSETSSLSEKFTEYDFVRLCQILGKNVESSKEILLKLRKIGIYIKENKKYRFSIGKIWDKAYNLLNDEKKKRIHVEFSEYSSEFSKRAWHYEQMGRKRSAAAMYIKAGRESFFKNKSWGIIEQYFLSAKSLLKHDEISDEMLMLPSLLTLLKGNILDDAVSERFKESKRLKHLYMYNLFLKGNFKEVQLFYKKINVHHKLKLEKFSDYANYLILALSYYETGKLDMALAMINPIYENIPRIKRFKYLRILFKLLLSRIYWRKNDWDKAQTYSKQNMESAENLKIKFLLPIVYDASGTIMDLYGPHYSKPILNKAIKYSETYGIPQLALKPTLSLANSYLYSGDISGMFSFIEKSREIARTYNDKNNLALSYLVEGLYHAYNKQIEEAVEDLEKAINLTDTYETTQKAKRFIVVASLLNGDMTNIDEAVLKEQFIQDYGFKDVIKLALSEDIEEIKLLFDKFKKPHHLWKEEIAVAFKDKLAKNCPREFERYLETLVQYYLKAHMKLPLALTYEAYAYLYRELGQYRKARKFARNAVDMYKSMKMAYAAKMINDDLLKGEQSAEDILNVISKSLRSGKKEITLSNTVLNNLETNLITKFNEMNVLHEIINFSKTITASAEPEQILSEFANWIISFVSIRKLVIAVLRDNKIIYKSWMSLNTHKKDEEEQLIKKMLKKRQGLIRTPFEAKAEFFIDDTHKVMLFVENSNLIMSNEEFDRFAHFIDNLEPIISMAIRNAISYKSSILDPLTGLYTRWYYTRRLQEEFDKSQRFDSPLSVIMADLDHFKRINDKYGHNVGDEVLKEVSELIKNAIRSYDVIGRYGGEEFVVILPNTSLNYAEEVAERIRLEVESCKAFDFNITLSLGVSCTTEKRYEKYLEIVADADRALYFSKNNGRNKVSLYNQNEEE
jgi:diguanylate cyclase (GGDEF)-like protein